MGRLFVRRWLLPLVLATALVVGMLLSIRTQIGPGDQTAPGSAEPRLPTAQPLPAGCIRDPAGLPPAPAGPDGRASNYLHVCGAHLYDSEGHKVRIAGLNWSGMETGDHVPGGLGARRWQEILDQVAALGYNTIRIPFSNEALEPGLKVGNVDFTLNPDLRDRSPLEVLDLLVQGARDRGLKVILDRHRTTPGSQNPLWYGPDLSENRWVEDWRMLAARYAGNDTVIAADLSNEPRDPATWGSGDLATDWRLAAERAGNAILEVNPYLLIFVEGIESYLGDRYWWGGNLAGVRVAPVRLSVPNRVVYSPHDYGPEVSRQFWFEEPGFPGNLRAIWDWHWGYIQRDGIAPVVVGEFGGHSVGNDRDGQWQRALLSYLETREMGAVVWSLNPSWDTGGILESDWRTVVGPKQAEYSRILAPPLAVGASGVFGRAPHRLRAIVRQNVSAGDGSTLSFEIANDGPDPVDLSHLELRYQIRAADRIDLGRSPSIEIPGAAIDLVQADFVGGERGGESYLRVRFTAAAGFLPGYQRSTRATVRLPESDPEGALAEVDRGLAGDARPPDRPPDARRIGLYQDGVLVWGR